MTITARMAAHLDALALEVIQNYSAARRQLDEWVGDHRATVIGASAPTSNSSGREPTPGDDVALTDVERRGDPEASDRALAILAAMDRTITRLAVDGRTMWADIDGVTIPEPAGTDAARLAVIMWTVRRIGRDRQSPPEARVGDFARRLEVLANDCRLHQPPPAARITACCHAHAAAGLEAEIHKDYRRHHLCDWCGKFRRIHGVNPPPHLVRLHDRGIKMTATILRRSGIRVTAA